jgi:hypothetical protein
MARSNQQPIQPPKNCRLYAVAHLHEYGHTIYLVWSDHAPREQELADRVLQAAYEPDRDESLLVDEVRLEDATVLRKPT